MSHTERISFTELESDQAKRFGYRFAQDAAGRTDRRRFAAELGMFKRLQRIVDNVNRYRSAEQRLSVLLRAFAQHIPAAQQGAIYLSTIADHTFIIGATCPGRSSTVGTEIDAQDGYIDAVAHVKCPVLLPDIQTEFFSEHQQVAGAASVVQSALVIPFIIGGKTVGVLSLENCEQASAFTEDDLNFSLRLSNYTAAIVDNARLLFAQPRSSCWESVELDTVQRLAKTMPTGILVVDQSRGRIWGNDAFCSATGFTQEELKNSLHKIHSELTQDVGILLSVDNPLRRDLTLTRRDRSSWPVKAVLLRFDSLGVRHAQGYVGIFEDLSEKSSLERRLFHMQRLSNVGTLMSGVAHELNNPLTAVVGFAELLLAREDMPSGSRKDLETIVRQSERSMSVVRELLDYVQLEPKEPTQIDVNDMIRQLVRFRMYALEGDDLAMTLDMQEPPPQVFGDIRQLQQVLLNLINNAQQACTLVGTSCKLRIGTEMTQEGKLVRIWIRDNGPGIPHEIQARVFEPFFTTKHTDEGAGLGLTICQQIITRHKGNIWFESEPDKGTTFFVELATVRGTPSRPKTNSSARPHTSEPPARILVVDDEKSISNLMAKVLTRAGHKVEIALDGRQALDKLQNHVYDIVFLDLKIPSLSGQAVYRWIKKNQAELLQRTVILTGDTLNTDTISFLEQEHVVHLLKPFQLVDLRNVLYQIWPK